MRAEMKFLHAVPRYTRDQEKKIKFVSLNTGCGRETGDYKNINPNTLLT